MDLLCLRARTIAEVFSDQVAAVGGGIDQHVIRPAFQASFQDSFQCSIVFGAVFKGEVIHKDDEFLGASAQYTDNLRKIAQMCLWNLHNTQSDIMVLIDQGLDR